jgi:archaeal cell division control protein 6
MEDMNKDESSFPDNQTDINNKENLSTVVEDQQINIKEEKSDEVRDELDDFFEDFLDKESLFVDKTVLQVKYLPDIVLHRTEQMKLLASILAPALKEDKPSNLFVYGKTGSGKTLCMKHTIQKMNRISEKREIPIRIIYLNCKMKKVADTEYRIIAQLAREIGEEVPMTGLPTDEVYNIFLNKLDTKKQTVLIVLDEIDQIVKKSGDEILYTLTRVNSELKQAQVAFIGISNDVRFMEDIDPRVKSSLGEEELIFPPYNALELKDILEKRSLKAFKKDIINPGVLAKCAAYAAREHGDARRALDLLRVAGEVAEREGHTKIDPMHIDMAEEKIEKSRILEIIETQPRQSQVVMYSILIVLEEKGKGDIAETGEVFETYKELCKKTGNNILTQRRISDLISELDMLGLINAKLISKGRYGRTREIYITIPKDMLDKIKSTLQGELF